MTVKKFIMDATGCHLPWLPQTQNTLFSSPVQSQRLLYKNCQDSSEFLKVTVSPSCDGAKFSWCCSKFCYLYLQTGKINNFLYFSILFCPFLPTLCASKRFFPHIPAQNFESKIVTAQKNLLTECLRFIIRLLTFFHWFPSGHKLDGVATLITYPLPTITITLFIKKKQGKSNQCQTPG